RDVEAARGPERELVAAEVLELERFPIAELGAIRAQSRRVGEPGIDAAALFGADVEPVELQRDFHRPFTPCCRTGTAASSRARTRGRRRPGVQAWRVCAFHPWSSP